MGTDRRGALAVLATAGAAATIGPAVARSRAAFVLPFRDADGYAVAVLDEWGRPVFSERLPGRGHGTAISPDGRHAVVFARRPGRFAVVLDLESQRRVVSFETPEHRHFYGHGTFAADGRVLFATENDYERERGTLGLYDATQGFRRLGEWQTHGIGPHEAILLRGGRTIAVANGGILTHPDYPRQKLNLATMRPSLVYLDARTGALIERAAPPASMHRLSIRHLAQAKDGKVWWGAQFEGPASEQVPLFGTHRRSTPLLPRPAAPAHHDRLARYVGSVAARRDADLVAVTSPRGGRLLLVNSQTGGVVEERVVDDICGVAPGDRGFLASDGEGRLWSTGTLMTNTASRAWDNHIARIW